MTYNLFSLDPPAKWRAGIAGICARAVENPGLKDIGVKKLPSGFYAPLMYCEPCYDLARGLARPRNEIQNGNRANRWTEVAIWKTKGGRYIAHVERFTQWQGESGSSEATSCASVFEVIECLQGEDGILGVVSQKAVEQASETDPAFANAWVEEVE